MKYNAMLNRITNNKMEAVQLLYSYIRYMKHSKLIKMLLFFLKFRAINVHVYNYTFLNIILSLLQ